MDTGWIDGPTQEQTDNSEFTSSVCSFDEHLWPWPATKMLRRQMANLHSFVVIGP